jgi:hypothetical protein
MTLSSTTYHHGVHLGLPPKGHWSDDWFDIVPGEHYRVAWSDGNIETPPKPFSLIHTYRSG